MMTLDSLREFFGICSLINIGILLYWFLVLMLAKGFVYRMHKTWFNLSDEKLDEIHYKALAFFKLSIFIFNIVPYFALRIMG